MHLAQSILFLILGYLFMVAFIGGLGLVANTCLDTLRQAVCNAWAKRRLPPGGYHIYDNYPLNP